MASLRGRIGRLILGSSSASRKELLGEMGLEFDVMSPEIDERAIRDRDPWALVQKLAHAKADALLERLNSDSSDDRSAAASPTLVLTGDQVVVHRDEILEKPRDAEEARRFIEGYNAAPARTVGSVVVTNVSNGKRYAATDVAEIYFREIPKEVVDALLKNGDLYYCAGGLKVEDPLVSRYVDHIVGGIDSVMGLCQATVERLLTEALDVE